MLKKTPVHVGIIMDGNRRWARANGVPLLKGHEAGAKRIEPIVAYAIERGIQYLTFWAFSTENWKRSETEIQFLFQICRDFFHDAVNSLLDQGARLVTIGEITAFPADIVKSIEDAKEKSKQNAKIVVSMALNYGGRQEILHAVKEIVKDQLAPFIAQLPEDDQEKLWYALHVSKETVKSLLQIDEKVFASYLYTHGQPDPDLIIRTGGAERLSGFLPWQAIYSELYFTKEYWPEFGKDAFVKALDEFSKRGRRFGK